MVFTGQRLPPSFFVRSVGLFSGSSRDGSILALILLLIYHLAGGSGVYLMLISGLGLIVGAKRSNSLLFARLFLPSSAPLKTRLGGV